MEAPSEHEALKWVNSLKMVKDMDSDFLNENRYENQKIYTKITGKTVFKDYEVLLEQYESKVHESIQTKLLAHMAKNFKSKPQNNPPPQQPKGKPPPKNAK